jgi:RNA polymerase sigma factor (sigma-70 family)
VPAGLFARCGDPAPPFLRLHRPQQAENVMTDQEIAVLVDGHRELLAFVERRVGSRALAEDILQDTLVRTLGRADELSGEDASLAWLYRSLRNAIVDHRRRSDASGRALTSLATELQDGGEPAPDERDALCRCIGKLATSLKPEYAAVIRRVDVDGISVGDFAEEAGITANNASVRLHRAREALRRSVASSCGTCAEHGCLDCGCRSRTDGAAR